MRLFEDLQIGKEPLHRVTEDVTYPRGPTAQIDAPIMLNMAKRQAGTELIATQTDGSAPTPT